MLIFFTDIAIFRFFEMQKFTKWSDAKSYLAVFEGPVLLSYGSQDSGLEVVYFDRQRKRNYPRTRLLLIRVACLARRNERRRRAAGRKRARMEAIWSRFTQRDLLAYRYAYDTTPNDGYYRALNYVPWPTRSVFSVS